MDLPGIWQEHKTFITLVMAGLLVFIIGQVVISELYPVDAEKTSVYRSRREIQRLEVVQREDLAAAEDDNEAYASTFESVVKRVNFVPREEFLLTPTESADVQYFRIVSREREALVEWPKTQNITVAANLGMPELSPTRKKEIQRNLLALDLVDRVVGLAIQSDMREVGTIEIVPDLRRRKTGFIDELKVRFKMLGTMAKTATFLEKLQFEENYLVLSEAELVAAAGDGTLLEADLTISAMTVLQGEEE